MDHLTSIVEEVILGGSAASFACLFTNPLEVVKTRLQLQGELQSRGSYSVHYRNFLHAIYAIGKSDGVAALQNGLVSGIVYQFVMNGTRLGTYQLMASYKLHYGRSGEVSFPRAIIMGGVSGAFGAFMGSPLYLVKTHLQAYSQSEIAVGFQRKRGSLFSSLRSIYQDKGVSGLWRGWQAQVLRVMAGSSVQLSTFSKCKNLLHQYKICDQDTIYNTTFASFLGGIVVTLVMGPFDVVSTRIYNQPIDEFGKGKYYSGTFDAFMKVLNKEGFFALYKGASGVFIRITPHTVITLVCWDQMRLLYYKYINKDLSKSTTG